jgi:hypothetical protein
MRYIDRYYSRFELIDGELRYRKKLSKNKSHHETHSRTVKGNRGMTPGALVGNLTKSGHRVVRIRGQNHYVSRVVWKMHYGDIDKGLLVNHINGNKEDYHIENLELIKRSKVKLKYKQGEEVVKSSRIIDYTLWNKIMARIRKKA